MKREYSRKISGTESFQLTNSSLPCRKDLFLDCLQVAINSDSRWGRELSLAPLKRRKNNQDPVALSFLIQFEL